MEWWARRFAPLPTLQSYQAFRHLRLFHHSPPAGGRYPDSHLESMKKPKVSFGPAGFPAFAGTMAVERVATGFRWAEGPVYIPAWRCVIFSDIPNNRMMRFSEDDGHVSVFRQPSMNSNGNTIDREGRLITCEHSGRRVTT